MPEPHGLDLRVGLIGGAGPLVERAARQRTFSGGWTSYLLQAALAFLLTDERSIDQVAYARTVYRQRRERFAEVLSRRQITVANRDGLGLWVPVRDERSTIVALASRGISVTPGSNFAVRRARQDHIRVAPSRVASGLDQLADTVAETIATGVTSTISI